MSDFTEEQKLYLEGFVAGAGLPQMLGGAATFAQTLGLSADQLPGGTAAKPQPASDVPAGPEVVHYRAQDAQVAAGKKLCPEELAKRKKFPLDQWDDLVQHSSAGKYPKGTDVLAFK